jgi:hypothetical protein
MDIAEIKHAVEILLKEGYIQVSVPYIHGKPGVGKSDIVKQIAKERGLSFIDLRLSQLESCDTRGIPAVNKETGSSRWYPPEMLPFETFSELPVPGKENKGKYFKDGGILFLDEINRPKFDVIQSIFELVHDRRIGLHSILDNWYIVAAGNLGEQDGTEITEVTDSAFNDRFIHFYVSDSGIFDCWKTWAEGPGKINSDIINFLTTKPSNVYTDPEEGSEVFASPRSWEKMSNLLKQNSDMDPKEIVDLFGPGLIGTVAVSFRDYLKTKTKITPLDILDRYDKFKTKLKKLERPKVYSLSIELTSYLKEHPDFNDGRIKNIHEFLNHHVDKDHMMAAFRILVDMKINYTGKLKDYNGKNCEFLDPYLDTYPDMNDMISSILESAGA